MLLFNLFGFRLLPKELLIESNIQRIVGNGSGLSRNKVLQKEVQDIYQLPLIFTSGGDAARGAALAVAPEQWTISILK